MYPLYYTYLFCTLTSSVVDPDPVGAVSFGQIRIRIVECENGPGTGRVAKKPVQKYKNIIIF